MALWKWHELKALGLTASEDGPDIQGVCIDSRQAKDGDLFIALSGDPGPRFNSSIESPRDGHDFIEGALKSGAAGVMISKPDTNLGAPYIQVEDTLDGLWSLGDAARHRCHGKIVAITGSAGKTTARSWLMQCLDGQFDVHGSIGSLNNHWGVPLSLSRMSESTQVGVFEIGTNHPGEISPLSRLVNPDLSILLNVLPAHIGNFPSMSALETEKRAIADGLSSTGTLVLPIELKSDDPRQMTFGLSSKADVSAGYSITDHGWQVSARVLGESYLFTMVSGGEHRLLTSLAVLAASSVLGADIGRVIHKMAALDSPEGRGNEWHIRGVTVIDDSYNANPVSMRYALDALRNRGGRRVAIIGEMNELGGEAARYHKEISELFTDFDEVITVGGGFELAPGHQHFSASDDVDIAQFVAGLSAGDTVLVKGSNTVFWTNGFVKALVAALEA